MEKNSFYSIGREILHKSYMCDFCKKIFMYQNYLEHLVSVHGGLYQCNVCMEPFAVKVLFSEI